MAAFKWQPLIFFCIVFLVSPSEGRGKPRDWAAKKEAAGRQRRNMREHAGKLKTCMESASTRDAKKKCFRDSKEACEADLGRACKDAYIKKDEKRGKNDEFLKALKDCHEAGETECMKKAKEAYGGTPNGYKMKRIQKDGRSRKLRDGMRECMEAANGDETAIANCKEAQREAMGKLTTDGRKPSRGKFKRALRDAAKSAAEEARDTCPEVDLNADAATQLEQIEVCDELVREAIAQTMGRTAENMTSFEVRSLRAKAANEAIMEAVAFCAEAKAEDPHATCEDLVEKYNKISGKRGRRKEGRRGKAELGLIQKKAAFATMMAAKKVCAAKETEAEVKECLEEAKADVELVFGKVYRGMKPGKLKKRHAREDEEASWKVVADAFEDCMEEREDEDRAAAKTACKQSMGEIKKRLGITKNDKILLKRKHANDAREAFKCLKNDRKKCLTDAREKAKRAGMQGREFGVVKRLALNKEVAEAWATCMDANEGDQQTCDDVAKTTFLEATGAKAEAWTEKHAQRAQTLGQAIRDGVETVIIKKQQLAIEHETDGTDCDTETAAKVMKNAIKVSRATIEGVRESRIIANRPPCVLVDEVPTYEWYLLAKGKTDEEIDALAEKVNTKIVELGGKALESARRLTSVALTNTDVAQDAEECPEGDATCGQTLEEPQQKITSSSTTFAVHYAALFFASMYGIMFG